ncbi:hypothetical protein HK101_000752 [Irineochytrium annulatum]|nr:hypothetical protein HK101_000752 [Irineochytrium annulatum]
MEPNGAPPAYSLYPDQPADTTPSAPRLDDLEDHPITTSTYIRPLLPASLSRSMSTSNSLSFQEDLRTLLVRHLKSSWLGSIFSDVKPAMELTITASTPATAFCVTSATLTETRSVVERIEPNDGSRAQQALRSANRTTLTVPSWADGITAANVDDVWRAPLSSSALRRWHSVKAPSTSHLPPWMVGTYKQDVPGTTETRKCTECVSKGFKPCRKCRSAGKLACTDCDATGKREKAAESDDESHRDRSARQRDSSSSRRGAKDEKKEYVTCQTCRGTGSNLCGKCKGTGKIKCETCEGHGSIVSWISLVITREVEVTNSVLIKRPTSAGVFYPLSMPALQKHVDWDKNDTFETIYAKDVGRPFGDPDYSPYAPASNVGSFVPKIVNPASSVTTDVLDQAAAIGLEDVSATIVTELKSASMAQGPFDTIVSPKKVRRVEGHRVWVTQGHFREVACRHQENMFEVYLRENVSRKSDDLHAEDVGDIGWIVSVEGYPSGNSYLYFGLSLAGVAAAAAGVAMLAANLR